MNDKFPIDSDITNFVAGQIVKCSFYDYSYVAHGMTKTDMDMGIAEKSSDIFLSSLGGKLNKPSKVYPVSDMTKREIWEYLPNDLRYLTWSCRTPIYENDTIKSCINCRPCKEIGEFNERSTILELS